MCISQPIPQIARRAHLSRRESHSARLAVSGMRGMGGRETGDGSAGVVEPKGVDRLGEAFHGLHDVLGSLLEIAQ